MSETTEENKPQVADEFPATQVTIEDAGAARKRVKLEIAPERIAAKIKEAYADLQHDAVLPGFRRGRAPMRLLEKRFGDEVKNTVKTQVVAEAYQKAVEDNKLDAIGEPDADLSKVELPESGPMTVTLEVEVTPSFELPNVENVAVKKPKLEATEERLNLAVENLRRHFGEWKVSSAPATDADAVVADVKVVDPDNNVVADQTDVQMAVKPGSIAGIRFDDLGEKLTGARQGATVALEGTVPADHAMVSLQGKKLTITLQVKDVRHFDMPEVTDEFAGMLGFTDVAELKKDLRDRLVVQLEIETKNAMAQQIYRYVLEHTQLELPANLSQRQMVNVLRRRATELMQRGVPEADIAQHLDELRISSAQQAALDLKLFFIMSKFAEKFDIKVSEGELNKRIAEIADQYGRRPEKLRQQMAQQGQLEQLLLNVRDGKVVDKILETATVTEVDEKTLAEEFKNLPPISGAGPHVTGISAASPTRPADAT